MTETSENPLVRANRDVVERLWTEPILDLCDADLPAPEDATVLAAEARCGVVVIRWLEKLSDDTRVMALDPSGPMLDEARSRIGDDRSQQLFFVEERIGSLSYADGVFDAATCFHGIVTDRQAREGLSELLRVISSGSPVVVGVPLRTSFQPFYDLFDEALRACQLEDVLPRIDEMRDNLLGPSEIAATARGAGLEDVEVSRLDWTIEFNGGREFLYSPLIQETFFPHWIGAVRSAEREKVLRHIGEAIDTYWHDRRLETEVHAGLVVGHKQ